MAKRLSYLKGKHDIVEELVERQGWDGVLTRIRKDLGDVLGSKNLTFLLGSGCSSFWSETANREVGIPTMGPMAKGFFALAAEEGGITDDERTNLSDTLGLNLSSPDFASNLEALMEVLFGYRFVLEHCSSLALLSAKPHVDSLIKKVTQYVLETCRNGPFSSGDNSVQDLYENFYRKLIHRDRGLPRPWVFTTNYDLFSETAMDRLGIPYINGFQGSVERRFNPATFRYSLAEQLDVSSRRWSSVDSLVYFAKLHGSVSWESREDGIFPVVETSPQLVTHENLLIYPTPAKQNASFASPYSDMFRELQTRVARDQSALITIGYSFSDEHVNNILFQALTIPTFRLVAFVDPSANETVKKLSSLDDPRIWIIGTDSAQQAGPPPMPKSVAVPGDADAGWRGHYFATIVEEFFAADKDNDANEAVEKIIRNFLTKEMGSSDEPK